MARKIRFRDQNKPKVKINVRIKKDDTVKVIAGRDKGKTGRVLNVDRIAGRVLVEGVSLVKRHTRPNPSRQIKGGIAERESSIAISNVMIVTSGGVAAWPRGSATAPRPQALRCAGSASRKRAAKFWIRRRNVMAARLREVYLTKVVPALTQEFGYKNPMAVPKIEKISLNMGVGEATQNSKLIDGAVNELGQIAGQRPVITKARKSIAAFKLREGMAIGCAVTLRGDRMYEFLDRLVNVSLPRVRDFRGVSSKSFDGRGNYTLGMKDQLIFPEIDYNKVEKTKGLNICITTTAKTDAEGLALLKHLGMPFRA
jgi:large subunit ribosomal protein L5